MRLDRLITRITHTEDVQRNLTATVVVQRAYATRSGGGIGESAKWVTTSRCRSIAILNCASAHRAIEPAFILQ